MKLFFLEGNLLEFFDVDGRKNKWGFSRCFDTIFGTSFVMGLNSLLPASMVSPILTANGPCRRSFLA